MKAQEIRNLANEEIIKKIGDNKKAIQSNGFARKYARVEKPHTIKQMKKEIARAKTILKERANEN